MRLTTIELEMTHCHSIGPRRMAKHLRKAGTHCEEARVVASKSPSIHGAMERVQNQEDKISSRRVRMEEERTKTKRPIMERICFGLIRIGPK